MKTLRLIFLAVVTLCAFASCEESSYDSDKARLIDDIIYQGKVDVLEKSDIYTLCWEMPQISTSKGDAVVSAFDVYLVLPELEAQKLIGTFNECKASIPSEYVREYLGGANEFKFAVCIHDYPPTNYTDAIVSDLQQWGTLKNISRNFVNFNDWFVCGDSVKEAVYGNYAAIDAKVTSPFSQQDIQFCNIFNELEGQYWGATFTLSFEVLWLSDTQDTATFSVLTGKNVNVNGEAIHEEYQSNEKLNTELIFNDGIWSGSDNNFYAVNKKWKYFKYGGKIGDKGEDYIGIQMNLAGVTGNNNGTFFFRNVIVSIDENIVAQYYSQEGGYIVDVVATEGGQVEVYGSHNQGDVITLLAIPDEGYVFAGWSDGDLNEKRLITLQSDISLEACFVKESSNGIFYVKVNTEGVGEVDGGGEYSLGQTVILNAEPGEGYEFSHWNDGNTDNPRTIYMNRNYDLTAIFKINTLTIGYKKANEWFLGGFNEREGNVEDGNIIVGVKGEVGQDEEGNYMVWSDNLEIMFQGLNDKGQDLQKEGGEFLITFDITWNGEAETAGFRICSDADAYIKEITDKNPSYYKDWDPWKLTDEQTNELIFNKNSELGTVYTVDKGQTVNVVWGGTITDRGANYIGIEINLAGYEDENGLHENGEGTFTISKFKVEIDGNLVFDMEK
ncbi:MAG: hypothetical protein J6T98_08390 [Salinivirgaceae bacterium]|nr:hypothetical protein [Salinivirgaceae bacterium]